ncbi:MAG: hypothetical protein ACP5N7_00455 [Candidatus Pacearchaeota archaeon]
MTDQKEFPSGIRFTDPHPKAPSFIMGKVSFKVDEFIQYLQEKADNGWVNLILKESQKGTKYFELDTWKPGTTEKYKPQEKVDNHMAYGQVAKVSYPKDEPIDYEEIKRVREEFENSGDLDTSKIPF